MNRKNLVLLQLIISLSLSFNFYSIQSLHAQQKAKGVKVPEQDTTNFIKGIFDIPELTVLPSPNSAQSFTFPPSDNIIDYDISPAGINVAALVVDKSGSNYIKFWQPGSNRLSDSLLLEKGISTKAVVWHPKGDALFVMAVKEGKYLIFNLKKQEKEWVSKMIFSTKTPLRRLVVCPRPFIVSNDSTNQRDYYNYRLFFGMENGDKSYKIVSITENGKKFYQVIGPGKNSPKKIEDDIVPSNMHAPYALPVVFHPAGHQLIWQDQNNNFYCANYDLRYWGKSKPMDVSIPKTGTITPTPNGLGLIHWQKNTPGIGIYLLSSKKEETQLQNCRFSTTPSSMPDGKGIVGLTFSNNQYTLNYLPITVPLADVENAWMYVNSKAEIDLFQKNFGLFRPNRFDQLYSLYDTENYECGGYARYQPTRPYLVTTDIFWELFGAAYQGIFIVKERDEAILDFKRFIAAANNYTKQAGTKSVWTNVFSILQDFITGNNQKPEVKRIVNQTDDISEITHEEYSFSDLKPRGHYTSSPEMSKYFKAFKYFTTILNANQEAIRELNLLPNEVKAYAEKWIKSYDGFISPSRSPLVWGNLKQTVPKYCRFPQSYLSIFPLSWGFDNEVLYSTVYHENSPKDMRLPESKVLPSGLELATVLGDGFAEKLLEPDYTKYPNLKNVITNLKDNYLENNHHSDNKNNLYSSWMDAIAVQWADTIKSPNGLKDRNIWQTKRLQTGLATWATLRHATVLVNERTSAECGEGGFEDIIMRAPRGYVEPDPKTFAAIAESAIQYVSKSIAGKRDMKDAYEESISTEAKTSLYDGIIGRLNEVAVQARRFQAMAEKEIKGEPLSNEENTQIFYIAGVAEHNFLIFNSLSNKEYALSNPDPIAKIADVAGGGALHIPYLMAAVGNAMEWNQIVPFYGRHEIVKGSIYAYYEFVSKQILNDKEWQKKVKSQEFLPWIKPFITNQKAEGIAETSY